MEIEGEPVKKTRAPVTEGGGRAHLRVARENERPPRGAARATPPVTRVLVVGTDDWAIDRAVTGLEAQSTAAQSTAAQATAAQSTAAQAFEVFRCHDPGEPVFPCNALRPGGVCPVVAGIDVVATVRSRPLRSLAQSEFGVICALREQVPLVVSGISPERPLKPWAAAVVEYEGDLGSACALVAGANSDPAATPGIEVRQGGV